MVAPRLLLLLPQVWESHRNHECKPLAAAGTEALRNGAVHSRMLWGTKLIVFHQKKPRSFEAVCVWDLKQRSRACGSQAAAL